MNNRVHEFRDKVAALPREDILELIKAQDPTGEGDRKTLYQQIRRIEYVFKHNLRHLNWPDGTIVEGRDFTNEELALILDPPFQPDDDLRKMGLSIEQQRQVFIASDSVLWAKQILGVSPRIYQIMILRHPKLRKVLRCGRRMGKTFCLAILLLHYAYTHKNARCLVLAPMKPQVGLIYEECRKLAAESASVNDCITRAVSSPQFEIDLSNGSIIRFFTTGLKAGNKSDIVRGQEAHLIVLDELDYMGIEDLDAIYIMLQKTQENQEDKILVGASTPTGRREKFWQWCTQDTRPDPKTGAPARFVEFWYPAYVNPMWSKDMEEEFRSEYKQEMTYRHEVEADWGEDVEGVYPRKYVDAAFLDPGWTYIPKMLNASSIYIMGVDWDKYAAGPNIVVLEACDDDNPDPRFQNKLRVAYREEIPRGEYALITAVERVIELNQIFEPEHIYVDRGYGDVQVELLHRYGVSNPASKLKKKLRGIQFSETIEVRDPASKLPDKKDIKVFMVENLRNLLEAGEIKFSAQDEELYMQLISYVVKRMTYGGKPVFEASGSQMDHAHDALILACLAYTQNYDDLHRLNIARKAYSISNEVFLPLFQLSDRDGERYKEEAYAEQTWGDVDSAPIARRRTNLYSARIKPGKTITRKKF